MKSFIIEQKITAFVNRYIVFDVDDHGGKGQVVAFAEQKRLAFREKFTVFTTEDKDTVLCTIQARQVLDFGARYDISDENGETLGVTGKDFKASLFRSTWHMYAPRAEDKPLVIVRERSMALAIFRRAWEIVPYISELPFFVKYHFDFVDPASQELEGSLDKTALLRDHYRLNLDDSLLEHLDWRVYISQAILLDALQSR